MYLSVRRRQTIGYHQTFAEGTAERMQILMQEVKNSSELKRIQCIYFRAKFGFDSKRIAEMVGLKDNTVRNIQYAYMKNGESALRLRGKGGRYNAHMSKEEEAEFISKFTEVAKTGGILEISQVYKAHCGAVGKNVSLSSTYRMLKRHGWRKIAPRPRHPNSNQAAIDDFKKTSEN